jgi:hypothetical protein
VKDFKMASGFTKGQSAFIKGRIYTIEYISNGIYLFNSEVGMSHSLTKEIINNYFIRERHLKLKRILNENT